MTVAAGSDTVPVLSVVECVGLPENLDCPSGCKPDLAVYGPHSSASCL